MTDPDGRRMSADVGRCRQMSAYMSAYVGRCRHICQQMSAYVGRCRHLQKRAFSGCWVKKTTVIMILLWNIHWYRPEALYNDWLNLDVNQCVPWNLHLSFFAPLKIMSVGDTDEKRLTPTVGICRQMSADVGICRHMSADVGVTSWGGPKGGTGHCNSPSSLRPCNRDSFSQKPYLGLF